MAKGREQDIARPGSVAARASVRLIHLDMLRGLAAIGVLLGHARSFVVVDYGSASTGSAWLKLFYGATSLGHQCVIAFFALSGFLVGGAALQGMLDAKWSWWRYILRRVTRLWMVLIPALLLTLGLDTAGRLMGGSAGYAGQFYNLISSGPGLASPADLSTATLLGNLLFLQTIVTPVLGTNSPLWSLANEFWYYMMFPLLLAALVARPWKSARAAVMGAVGIGLVCLLPTDMVLLGLIWVAGALAHHGLRSAGSITARKVWVIWFLLCLAGVVAGTIIDKRWPGILADISLGLAFAAMLPSLARLPALGSTYHSVADFVAKLSYTLYATHFPVLAFIWFVMLAPRKWVLGIESSVLMACMISAGLVVACGMWWLFERNTDRVRMALERLILRSAARRAI